MRNFEGSHLISFRYIVARYIATHFCGWLLLWRYVFIGYLFYIKGRPFLPRSSLQTHYGESKRLVFGVQAKIDFYRMPSFQIIPYRHYKLP